MRGFKEDGRFIVFGVISGSAGTIILNLPGPAILVFLTVVRGRRYSHFMMCGIVRELNDRRDATQPNCHLLSSNSKSSCKP